MFKAYLVVLILNLLCFANCQNHSPQLSEPITPKSEESFNPLAHKIAAIAKDLTASQKEGLQEAAGPSSLALLGGDGSSGSSASPRSVEGLPFLGEKANAYLRQLLPSLAMPAAFNSPEPQEVRYYKWLLRTESEALSDKGGSITEKILESSSLRMESIEIVPHNGEILGQLVYVGGNDDHFQERLSELLALSVHSNTVVTALNYPKEAKTFSQIIGAFTEFAQLYSSKGLLVLMGRSLGGAIVTEIAGNLRKLPSVRLITDRSFTDIAKVVSEQTKMPASLANAILRRYGLELQPQQTAFSLSAKIQKHYYVDNDEVIRGATTKAYEGKLPVIKLEIPRQTLSRHNEVMRNLQTFWGRPMIADIAATIKKFHDELPDPSEVSAGSQDN